MITAVKICLILPFISSPICRPVCKFLSDPYGYFLVVRNEGDRSTQLNARKICSLLPAPALIVWCVRGCYLDPLACRHERGTKNIIINIQSKTDGDPSTWIIHGLTLSYDIQQGFLALEYNSMQSNIWPHFCLQIVPAFPTATSA